MKKTWKWPSYYRWRTNFAQTKIECYNLQEDGTAMFAGMESSMDLSWCFLVNQQEMQVINTEIYLIHIYIYKYICLADIWLSLKFRPPVTISDTPCTLAANICK